MGPPPSFVPCDISDRAQVESLIGGTVERFGRLDVMVNNAGINTGLDQERVNIDKFLDETWHRILNVDLTGTFYCCRAAAAQMVKQHAGSIVNISSVAGVVALRLQIAFCAAKAAILKLTEAMACEIGPQGVRVNAISPGSIDVTAGRLSEVPEAQGGYAERARASIRSFPQRRLGRPRKLPTRWCSWLPMPPATSTATTSWSTAAGPAASIGIGDKRKRLRDKGIGHAGRRRRRDRRRLSSQ